MQSGSAGERLSNPRFPIEDLARELSTARRDCNILNIVRLHTRPTGSADGTGSADREDETRAHLRRTQQFIKLLAEAALARRIYAPELDAEQVDLMVKAAPLHDIGKIGIPDSILRKPGKLTADEFEVMKTHTEMGRAALESAEKRLGERTPFSAMAQAIAYSHHERWDGSGYPLGLKGNEIPLAGRFMAIVDVYDALVSERVYKKGMSHAEAVAIIAAQSGRHFDPKLVEVFLEIEHEFPDVSRFLRDDAEVNLPRAAAAS